MLQAFKRSRVWLPALLVAMLVLLSPAANLTAQAAVNDVATPFVTDNAVQLWTLGSGLAYWGYNCEGVEVVPDTDAAALSRIPASGGTIRRLDTPGETDGSRCNTYQKMLSSSDGLYFYEEVFGEPVVHHIMRMPQNAPFTPKEVKVLAAGEIPSGGQAFVEAGGFLYWSTSSDTIVRMRKNGSGAVQLVANTGINPNSVLVVGSGIYWADSTGVHSKSISCATLPCEGGQSYRTITFGTNVYGVLYESLPNTQVLRGRYRIYWVEASTAPGPAGHTNFAINYRTCVDIQPCGDIVANPGVQAQSATSPDAVDDDIQILYASATDWAIGAPVLANGNVFWTESINTLNPDVHDGALKRKQSGKVQADPTDELLTSQSFIDGRLFVFNDKLYFAREGTGLGIFTLPLNATPILRDLTFTGMEVTQAVQNLANDVPLIADKTTYVRVYGFELSGPNTPDAETQLIGTRNDIPLPGSPLKPVNGIRSILTLHSYDRANLNDSWYFQLPASWISAGNIKLQAVIDPRHLHSDSNPANNLYPADAPLQVTFQTQPPVCVDAVPVRTHNPLPTIYDRNFSQMVSEFTRRWPIPQTWIYYDSDPVEELEICTWHYIPYPCFGPYELSDGWGITNGIPDRDKVIASLWTRQLLSFNPDACDDIGAPVQAMGMVHPDADNGGSSGYASLVSSQSWVQLPQHNYTYGPDWDVMREGSVMAQELAHNHGRHHVDCGGPSDVDTNYPYPPCQIAPTDSAGYYGFDVATRRPIAPQRASDFMSYRDPAWVSDYTYRSLFNDFVSASAASGAPDAVAAGDQVYVTGMVDGENPRGEITLLLILPGSSLPPATRQMQVASTASVASVATVDHDEEPVITYTLRFVDADGNPIDINGPATGTDRKLLLNQLDDHSNESSAQVFVDIFDKPAAQAAKVLLLADGTPIYTLTAGTHVPVVTVQKPTGGTVVENQMTIQWTASDDDPDDRLKFTVQYSHDNGASWQTLGINLPSTPEITNTLDITDLGSLQGSADNAAKIRVMATDGYNTAIAESANFTVKNRPPLVIIVAPTAGQDLVGGESALLQGMVTDPEDGGLSGSSLKWGVDGIFYGFGDTISADGLGSFTHTATLAATDANTQTVTATVNFNIAPLAIPLGTEPTMDGLCSDPGYTSAVNLALSQYGDSTRANARIMRSDDYLWVCFTDLQTGAADPDSYVGLRADIDNSRDPLAKADDAGFFVAEDGSVFSLKGDDNGDLVAPGPEGVAGQIIISGTTWSAELRIDKANLGGWDHLVSLAVGHHSVNSAGDDYSWPYQAQWAKPNTWSEAALGIQPVIVGITPNSAPANVGAASTVSAAAVDASLTLTVEGSGFVSGTQVLWNGEVLATTFITDSILSAQIPSAKLNTTGVVQITTCAPAPANFVSTGLPFIVEGLRPTIASLSPSHVLAEAASFELTINGSNFAPDAQVLWNDTELTPQFINSGQLKVQIDASLLINGTDVGVAVGNPTPNAKISGLATFTIQGTAPGQNSLFVPGLFKQP